MTEQPFDPQLKAAMAEIREVCERFDVAFSGMLVSPTHSEFLTHFPTWSVAQFEDQETGETGIRVRSRQADYEDTDDQHFEAESTTHMIDQWRNWHARQLEVTSALLLMIGQHWEITSDLDKQEPHGHDILGEWSAHDPASQPTGGRAERRRRHRELQKQMKRDIKQGQMPPGRIIRPQPKTPIARAWEDWQQAVLEPIQVRPGQTQYIETRRAFYAGGWTTFKVVVGISDRFEEEEAMGLMTEIDEEFKAFHARVGTEGF